MTERLSDENLSKISKYVDGYAAYGAMLLVDRAVSRAISSALIELCEKRAADIWRLPILTNIARQLLTDEMPKDEREGGDYEYAYDKIVQDVRTVLCDKPPIP